ncbi:MAG: hypothetical protein ACR2HM_08250 [Acidimicrobiales bacterium]
MSLNNLANCLSDAGRRDEAEELVAGVVAEFAGTPLGVGHIRVVRGRWLARDGHTAEAADDLAAAAAAFEEAGDMLWRGKARQALRARREADPAAFDAWWPAAGAVMPAWLAHPGPDEALAEALIAWIATPAWDASEAYLAEHAGTLLTERGEAEIEHLIDANPSHPGLVEHLELLQAARSSGIETAYRAHSERSLFQDMSMVVQGWISTSTWDRSYAFAAGHEELLSIPATLVLQDLASEQPRDPERRLHRGLLALVQLDGIDAAYAVLDPAATQAAAAAEGAGEPTDRALALVRIHSGLVPDSTEAHFRLATLAIRLGEAGEAAAALADCADHAAPFERSDFARRLDLLVGTDPELAPLVTELRALLAGSPGQGVEPAHRGEPGEVGVGRAHL